MSPVPLIELQRRLAEAGRIRMGAKTDKGAPKRLTTWRITSPTRELVEQAAGIYGGKVEPWESPTGSQFEVVTTSQELQVLVMPGYSFRQGYEHRTSPTKVERRCDGNEMDDGQPCLCNTAGEEDLCDLVTRLTVALPELTTMLGWRLETKGENAARELLASMDLVQGVAQGRPFMPARLRIVERRGNVNGQAVRYVVPVIDVSVRYAELGLAEQPAAGYKPLAQLPAGVTLEQGLAAAEQPAARVERARSAAPIPAHDDADFDGDPVPVPIEENEKVKLATEAQRRKLFATARDHGVTEDRLKELIRQVNDGNDSTRALPRDRVDAVLTAIQAEPTPEGQFPIPEGAR